MTRVEDRGDRWVVSCEEHAFLRAVATAQHAANLEALHNRVEHADDTDPISVNLTAAARMVTQIVMAPAESWDCAASDAALDVWEALTGLGPIDALAYARQLGSATPSITASIPPF